MRITHNLVRLRSLSPLHGGEPKIGGPDQVRTDDLLNAIEALFQLSYEPIRVCEDKKNRSFRAEGKEFLGTEECTRPSVSH